MFSRIDKLLREAKGTASLAEARDARNQDVELLVGRPASTNIVRPAVALALRCFTGSVAVNPAPGTPEEVIQSAVEEAAGYGMPDRLRIRHSPGSPVRLALSIEHPPSISVDASGWLVGVNRWLPTRNAPAAPAAAFAAAAGFSKLFAKMLGAHEGITSESWTWSLLDFSLDGAPRESHAALDFGNVSMLGAGAIGSAFAYVLFLSDWSGSIRIIDFDRYDSPNHETTMLISRDDAFGARKKAETLARRASRSGLVTESVHRELVAGDPELQTPRRYFVCGVDNPETRCILDGGSATVMYNAGVGGTPADAGHLLWSRHGPSDGSLSSLYERSTATAKPTSAPPSEVADDECSRIAYEGVSMAAPFLGLGAGALLAAGIAQNELGVPVDVNYLKLDLLALQSRYIGLRRRPGR